MASLIRDICILILVKNCIFYYFVVRPGSKDERKRINKEALLGAIKEVLSQLPYVILMGIIPTVILFMYPGENGPISDLKAYLPLDQIVWYFFFLLVMGLICMWLNIKNFISVSFVNSFIDSSISAFQGIFQATSGVMVALSTFYLINEGLSFNALKFSLLIYLASLTLLIPSIFTTNVIRNYKKSLTN